MQALETTMWILHSMDIVYSFLVNPIVYNVPMVHCTIYGTRRMIQKNNNNIAP